MRVARSHRAPFDDALEARFDAIDARLGAFEGRIAALEAQVVQRWVSAKSADAANAARDRVLLAAIVQHMPAVLFGAAELLAHGRVHVALGAALAAAGIRNPRTLGKRLRAVLARPVPGFHVEQVGRDRAGWLWSVEVEP